MVRREGFEPPAFWSVGCLKGKSESFRLRFVLFTTVHSADFPLFPSRPARFFRILGQNWVKHFESISLYLFSRMRLTVSRLWAPFYLLGWYKPISQILRRFDGTLNIGKEQGGFQPCSYRSEYAIQFNKPEIWKLWFYKWLLPLIGR